MKAVQAALDNYKDLANAEHIGTRERQCHEESIKAADQECTDKTQRMASLETLLEDWLDNTEAPPDSNCSCHLSAPCSDCGDFAHLRDLRERTKLALAGVH